MAADANPARETLLRETLAARAHHRCLARIGRSGRRRHRRGVWKAFAHRRRPIRPRKRWSSRWRCARRWKREGRTAALVTPDRNLARRVAAELARWDIAIDDSAGRPLAHTGAGAFCACWRKRRSAASRRCRCWRCSSIPSPAWAATRLPFRSHARALDRCALRGPRPDPGLPASPGRSHARGANARNETRPRPGAASRGGATSPSILAPLEQAFRASRADTRRPDRDAMSRRRSSLSCDEAQDCPLWRDADGEAAALFFDAIPRSSAAGLPPIEPRCLSAPCCALWR